MLPLQLEVEYEGSLLTGATRLWRGRPLALHLELWGDCHQSGLLPRTLTVLGALPCDAAPFTVPRGCSLASRTAVCSQISSLSLTSLSSCSLRTGVCLKRLSPLTSDTPLWLDLQRRAQSQCSQLPSVWM